MGDDHYILTWLEVVSMYIPTYMQQAGNRDMPKFNSYPLLNAHEMELKKGVPRRFRMYLVRTLGTH